MTRSQRYHGPFGLNPDRNQPALKGRNDPMRPILIFLLTCRAAPVLADEPYKG